MTTIMPTSELLRQAVSWMDEQLEARPHVPISSLLDEAGMRFNLGPLDSQWLGNLFKTAKSTKNISEKGQK